MGVVEWVGVVRLAGGVAGWGWGWWSGWGLLG